MGKIFIKKNCYITEEKILRIAKILKEKNKENFSNSYDFQEMLEDLSKLEKIEENEQEEGNIKTFLPPIIINENIPEKGGIT